jgi:hypothetical protein
MSGAASSTWASLGHREADEAETGGGVSVMPRATKNTAILD